jgi:hypothetical protein
VELVCKITDTLTFLHYSGSTTNPDLALVSAHLKDSTDKEVIADPGSGHQPVIVTINLGRTKQIRRQRTAWDFKKANWFLYTKEIEIEAKKLNLQDNPRTFTQSSMPYNERKR